MNMNMDTHSIAGRPVPPTDFAQRLWDSGQSLLAAGRYVAARRELEAAERQAFFKRDAALLASIYLPLLEAARQIRQFCCDGVIAITPCGTADTRKASRELAATGGVGLLIQTHGMRPPRVPATPADTPVEYLHIIQHGRTWSITPTTPARSRVPVQWVQNPARIISPAQPDQLLAILPPPGIYRPGEPRHAQARETLLLTWEALALQLLQPHTAKLEGWVKLSLLRRARRIDPACESVVMQMMAAAKNLI
jgi:hypothetical protein